MLFIAGATLSPRLQVGSTTVIDGEDLKLTLSSPLRIKQSLPGTVLPALYFPGRRQPAKSKKPARDCQVPAGLFCDRFFVMTLPHGSVMLFDYMIRCGFKE
jgi:hypothetical protein